APPTVHTRHATRGAPALALWAGPATVARRPASVPRYARPLVATSTSCVRVTGLLVFRSPQTAGLHRRLASPCGCGSHYGPATSCGWHYRSFNVVSASRASANDTIQKRTTILGSGQPVNS